MSLTISTAARGLAMAGAIATLALATSPRPLAAQDNPGNKASVQVAAEGKELYEQICQACHMPDAKGGAGAGTGVPALAGNPHLADKAFTIGTVWNGRGGMPRFAGMLSSSQIAAVLTYVRSHFNVYPDTITETEVITIANGPPPKNDCGSCRH